MSQPSYPQQPPPYYGSGPTPPRKGPNIPPWAWIGGGVALVVLIAVGSTGALGTTPAQLTATAVATQGAKNQTAIAASGATFAPVPSPTVPPPTAAAVARVAITATPRPSPSPPPTSTARPTGTPAPLPTATPVTPYALAADCVTLTQLKERPFKEGDTVCVEAPITIQERSRGITFFYFQGDFQYSINKKVSDALSVLISSREEIPDYTNGVVQVRGVLKKDLRIRWSISLENQFQIKLLPVTLKEYNDLVPVDTYIAPVLTSPPAPVLQQTQPPVPASGGGNPIPTGKDVGSFPCEAGQIKGNNRSMIYHVPGQRDYEKTQTDVTCFSTEASAAAAGFRKAQR